VQTIWAFDQHALHASHFGGFEIVYWIIPNEKNGLSGQADHLD
jgi:hypothetical protein